MPKMPKDKYVDELWKAFGKTGSLSAYILFCHAKKNVEKAKKKKSAK